MMKLTLSWLNEYIKIKSNPEEISQGLTGLGLEVESLENTNKEFNNFLICKIIKVNKHPNADRLKVCEVFCGAKNYKVVCGAANAVKGLKTIFAPNGTFIPGSNFRLEKKKY